MSFVSGEVRANGITVCQPSVFIISFMSLTHNRRWSFYIVGTKQLHRRKQSQSELVEKWPINICLVWFGLVSLFYGISTLCRLFNAEAILEEQ